MDKSINLLKPLNILVFVDNEQHDKSNLTGANDYLINLNDPLEETKNKLIKKSYFTTEYCDELFNNIQNFLTFYLSQNFTIYSTTLDELNRGAWLNTTKLLIIVQNDFDKESDYLEQIKSKIIDQFREETNNVVILNHKLLTTKINCKQFGNLNIELLKDKIKEKIGDEYIYENFNIPDLTTHYVYSDILREKNQLIDYLNRSNIKTESFNNNIINLDFDIQKYLKHLEPSNRLGRNLIVANVTKSTQPIAENSPIIDGLVVITNQQTEGKGRGKNQWLSPSGSISFTYAVSVPIHSTLFKYLAFYQHINALGILLAIKKFNNMDQLDLKIKWPNDIYYKEKYKLVGILTNSKFEGDCAKFFIGTGINLSNCKPTYSLKNIVENDLKQEFTISKEELIAEVLNQIDNLIKIINNQGKEEIIDLYYKNWMMKNKVIQLSNGKHATVCGLDEDGYLRVNLIDDGEIVSLLPDGNPFDILFGLKEFNN